LKLKYYEIIYILDKIVPTAEEIAAKEEKNKKGKEACEAWGSDSRAN